MLVLIGITTPHATSAPADNALLDRPAPLFSEAMLDDPSAIMLLGAAMLVIAGVLRRSDGGGKVRG